MKKVYLSREGYDKLKKELVDLKTNQRPAISKQIAEARAHGDLKENAEYDVARHAQGLSEARIAELESKLAVAKIIDNSEMSTDEIYIGATVTLLDIDLEKEIVYTLVSEDEADFAAKKISVASPIGKGLLGHKKGDKVSIQVPARTINYEVRGISR